MFGHRCKLLRQGGRVDRLVVIFDNRAFAIGENQGQTVDFEATSSSCRRQLN
jgi:hypothetical protein